ncbi:MAG: ATP-dependent zinc metalloprotease FtsH [Bacteroidales bacterium]|nr:ATP-dependent zinc metalloprotease FtsH [Bacteroidales bacterium]
MEGNKGFKPNNENQGLPNNGGNGKARIIIYIVIFAVLIVISFVDFGGGANEINWNKFENEMLLTNDVEKVVVVNRERADVYLKPESLDKFSGAARGSSIFSGASPAFYFTIGDVESFENKLAEAQKDMPKEQRVSVEYKTEHDYLGSIISWIFPIVLIIVLWWFVFNRMSGGSGGGGQIFNIGKSKAQVFDKERKVKVNFKDVAGLEEAKVEVMEIVDFLKNPEKYTKLGGKIPKGALLVGPPGTGKTLLAKAVAGEADVPFFSLSGSDFVEMFVGVGASRVRDLFRQAKSKAPCIIFIDEIDAIGRARGKSNSFSGNDERENTLNQLLTEMDGFDTNSGVIILAATNRAEILDSALMRAGRFDRQIHLELPDVKEREEIFQVHTKNLKMASSVKIDFLAKQTPGFSGADIANVCNEAALIAARNDKKEIDKQDFLDAVDRIIGGLEKKNKIISETEKRTIAYHEAGHATVSWLLEYANPLLKVTIIPRGKALGAAWYLPEERSITTKEQLLDEMCATLGGRASEEINFGKVSTGALNDLERVTKQAIAMVSFYGMSNDIGNLSYYNSTDDYGFTKPYSDKTAEKIDADVKAMVEEQYERAKEVLRDNMEGLTQLAETLLEKEVIFSDDLERIFGKRKGENKALDAINEAKEQEKAEAEKQTADAETAPSTDAQGAENIDNANTES